MVYPSKLHKPVILAGNADGNLTQWEIKKGKQIAKIQEPGNQILAIDYTVSGQNFASAGQDFKVQT